MGATTEVVPAESHLEAVAELDAPGPARIELDGREAEPCRQQPAPHPQVFRGHSGLAAVGTGQPGQLRRDMAGLGHEELTPHVEQAAFLPAGRRFLLGQRDLGGQPLHRTGHRR